jgi:hypothetical protein
MRVVFVALWNDSSHSLLDSNIANIGSDLDKKIRQAAAQTEPAWANAGKQVGLQIWRIGKAASSLMIQKFFFLLMTSLFCHLCHFCHSPSNTFNREVPSEVHS